MEYLPRIMDSEIGDRLAFMGAVLIDGVKGCGKTETARRHAASEVRLDTDSNARLLAETNPSLILTPPYPKLIDEWQVVPSVWNHIRRAIDDSHEKGMFLLTGSSTPPDDPERHSGAGRISRLRLRTLSTYERERPVAHLSLDDLISGISASITAPEPDLQRTLTSVVRGGWPGTIHLTDAQAISWMRSYIEELSDSRIRESLDIRYDSHRLSGMLLALARHTATRVSMATLAKDLTGILSTPVSEQATARYFEALISIMAYEPLPAWGAHLRSKTRAQSSPVMMPVDPAIPAAALHADTGFLINDLNLAGQLFEAYVTRDIRVYADTFRGDTFHFRDDSGLEVDLIVQAGARAWGAFEVKLGANTQVLDGAAGKLLEFSRKVDTSKTGEPGCLGIISAMAPYGYKRPDGVWVLPYTILGP